MLRFLLASFAALLVTACGGGDAAPKDAGFAGQCEFITGGGATIAAHPDSGCTDCSAGNVERAADGDLASAALIAGGYYPADCGLLGCRSDAQGIEVRAKAQPGVVYPAGNVAGAWMKSNGSWAASIATYLNGELQEGGRNTQGSVSGGDPGYLGIETQKPFDEVGIYLQHNADDAATMDLVEICSDSPFLRQFSP